VLETDGEAKAVFSLLCDVAGMIVTTDSFVDENPEAVLR
jgi:hypothetical protein